MSELTNNPISSDRPILESSEDRLGFALIAERLASALVHQASTEGLVVGMEGSWGSGKSSLLNLTVKAFSELSEKSRPVVVEFKPWLIGNRDALIASFFEQLVAEVEKMEVESDQHIVKDSRTRKELSKRIQAYVEKAEKVGSVMKVIPFAERIGAIIQGVASMAKKPLASPSLPQQKREIDASLDMLTRRIVVTIDDVDRLEPQEVIELLRLIRSVADFRNIIYVLCFDANILARSIETGIGVESGHAYLEKIIQISISVPIPEPFHLRRWFEKDLSKIVNLEDFQLSQRLARVIDFEGGRRFKTPRTVTRTLNNLSLLLPSLNGKVDLPDLVWLQIIKGSDQNFYRWIEGYVAECAATTELRVSINDISKKRTFGNLQQILELGGASVEDYQYELSEYLPGVRVLGFPANKEEIPIFNRMTEDEIERAIRDKRLASPDHYRLYFALAQPVLAPKAEDFRELIAATNTSVQNVIQLFLGWVELQDPTIGTKADVILSRIRQRLANTLTSAQAKTLLLALSDVLDEAGKRGTLDDFRSPSLWRAAERCIPLLRTAMTPDDFQTAVFQSFKHGRALGWLTDLLRAETFNHGRFGDRKTHESEWVFTEEEYDSIARLMISRYCSMSLNDFAELPSMVSALFAWQQAGDNDRPRKLVEDAVKTDEGLVCVLENFVSTIRSSEGDYKALNPDSIKHFLDYKNARSRIEALSKNGSSDVASRATRLLEQFKAYDHF